MESEPELTAKSRVFSGLMTRKVQPEPNCFSAASVNFSCSEARPPKSRTIASSSLPVGFVFRGGPMNYADTVGLYNVVARMRRFAANPLDDREFWQPAPLLARLAAEGKSFS